MMIPDENTGVVVLTNRSDVKAMVLAEQLLGDLRGPLWRENTERALPIQSRWGNPSTADLLPYTGAYQFRRGPAKVRVGAQGVTINTPSRSDGPNRDLPTCRVARDRFVCLGDGHVVEFLRDDSERIAGFAHSGYLYTRSAGSQG